MTLFALLLILVAAAFHATWNLFAKRSGGGAPFVWLFAALSLALYAPFALALWLWQRLPLSGTAGLFILGTSVLHLGYFLSLQRGYRVGDLSLVYPLARGSGPMLASLVAVALLGERPTPLALAGGALIVVSIFVIAGSPGQSRGRNRRAAFGYGLLTGAFIAAYTLVDKVAVSVLFIPPLLFTWLGEVGRTALLTPLALRRWGEVRREWREHRLEVFVVALLSPLAYILVLTALVYTPVSYVAPAREVSILIGAVMGSRLLAEEGARRRLWAASAMVLGVVLLALG